MTLPSDPWFLVSYKLVPLSGGQTASINLKGVFSFVDGKKTGSVDILEQDVSLDALTQTQVEGLLAYTSPASSATSNTNDTTKTLAQNTNRINGSSIDKGTAGTSGNTTIDKINTANTTNANTNSKNNTNNSKNTGTKNTQNPESGTKGETSVIAKNNTTKTTTVGSKILRNIVRRINEKSVMAYSLEPENGIYYRVQIAAGHQPVNMNKYFRKMNFREKIRTEQHEGWYKYSIGSWNQYREARDYRVQMRNTSIVKDAFVAAYNSGKRITVQEALMVSNQKWYQ
jgi:hypothetical protein